MVFVLGPQLVQPRSFQPAGGSEDCLYLNIWAPLDASPSSLKPVKVWIYVSGRGGTFVECSCYVASYFFLLFFVSFLFPSFSRLNTNQGGSFVNGAGSLPYYNGVPLVLDTDSIVVHFQLPPRPPGLDCSLLAACREQRSKLWVPGAYFVCEMIT